MKNVTNKKLKIISIIIYIFFSPVFTEILFRQYNTIIIVLIRVNIINININMK